MRSLRHRFVPVAPPRAGSVATLWTVRDRALGGMCVLKLAPTGTSAASSLLQESALLADLGHPRVVPCLDRFDDVTFEGQAVSGFSMPWIDGERIDRALACQPVEQRIAAFTEVLEALRYLHAREVLHLDLKPSNILVGADGPIVLDLGTAQRAELGKQESGGTLGYAAPEVLLRRGPTAASDVYSLGTILYELLAGQPPFAGQTPFDLRRAVLDGDPVPLRAVAAEVPMPVAALVHEMMAVDPAQRPASVELVADRLVELGFPRAARVIGAPPLVGRDRELEDLLQVLGEGTAPVAVVGEPGSGRARLARAALGHFLQQRDRLAIDLSRAADLLLALQAVVVQDGAALLDADSPVEAIARHLTRGVSWQGRLYVGRAEELPAPTREALVGLQPLLAEAGIGLVWACSRPPRGARPFPIGPLSAPDLDTIGRFTGVAPGSDLRQAVVASGGNPRLLLEALAVHTIEVDPESARVAEVLRTLPEGIPADVIGSLPERWRSGAAQLVEVGLARTRADSALLVYGSRAGVPLHPDIRECVVEAVRQRAGGDPHWRALALCRAGLASEALPLVDSLLEQRELTRERLELFEHLARAGDPRCAAAAYKHHEADGRYDDALAALDLAPDPSHDHLRVRALFHAGRLEEAEAAARAAPDDDLDTLVVACRIPLRRNDVAAATAQIEEVARRAPDDRDLPNLRLSLAAAKRRLGLDVPELTTIVDEVASRDLATVSPAALFNCAWELQKQGQPERAAQLVQVAAEGADAKGDLRFATRCRYVLGNALTEAGRGKEARRAYTDARFGARALRSDTLLIRVLYALAHLELRAGRPGPTEQVLAEYREVAARLDDPEVRFRETEVEALLAELQGRPDEVLRLLEPLRDAEITPGFRDALAMARARAHVALDRPEEALQELDGLAPRKQPYEIQDVATIRGRAHLALARRQLAEARAHVPEDPEALDRVLTGRVLLAAAGEDLDPDGFEQRRRDLTRAAGLLQGDDASRAATLRDRLLSTPGAGLAGIVDLLETVQDPKRFPRMLARIVSEALGANRVLILMRLPGLGRQLGYKELTQAEVAGISEEVMRRIVRPDDVWLAADAFADPAIREVSATVRTFEIRSVLAVAIPSGDHAVGALYVDDLHRSNRFSTDDVAVLRRLAAATAHLIGMLTPGAVHGTVLDEPEDLLGVLLSDVRQVAEMKQTLEMLRDGRRQHTNLLITGATGTGKTWLARRIATEVLGLEGIVEQTIRHTEPDKLVSALAGTKRGEFTGAVEQKGALKLALDDRSALFLDEVQALDDGGQTALLPLLELPQRRFAGLTGTAGRIEQPLAVILGTNVDVSAGRWRQHFRQDLWFRMSQLHIHLPTLAERGPEVVYRYLADFLRKEGLELEPEKVLEPPALQHAVGWSWPGNLRQLTAAAKEIAFRFRRSETPLSRADLDELRVFRQQEEESPAPAPTPAQREIEIPADPFVAQVWRVLPRVGWNQSEVARLVGCSPSKVNRALKGAGLMGEVRLRRARELERQSG